MRRAAAAASCRLLLAAREHAVGPVEPFSGIDSQLGRFDAS
jgi:hypothetical protein